MEGKAYCPSKAYGDQPSAESWNETALRQLKADIEENRFVYNRQRKYVKKENGTLGRKKEEGAYVYVYFDLVLRLHK